MTALTTTPVTPPASATPPPAATPGGAPTAPTPAPRRRGAWFWDRPIATKVATALLVLGVSFSVVGGAGAVALWRSAEHLEQMSRLNTELQRSFADLSVDQARSHLLVQRAADADPTTREQLLTSSAWVDEDVAAQVAVIESFPEAATPQWEDFRTRWDAWTAYRDSTLVPLVRAGDAAGFRAAVAGDVAADPDWAGRALALASAQTDADVVAIQEAGQAEARTMIAVLAVAFVVASACAALLALATVRRINRSVQAVAATVDALAEGDLTRETSVAERDEIGRMAAGLDRARDSLRATLAGVVETAAVVAGSAERLREANGDVAAGAEET
ncbi:HAMP domain-containing protein, partial [Puerhibacterium sp. TATVAM-FAB25]|uniref:HAMP domain-containing protein n=1 Tax=Puerhibacterium sp. TATVAM-FAB25 TaxID=3093699 RepID=UPI00397A59D8